MTVTTTARLDSVLGLLSDRDRRRLLYYLREHGSATRSELADVLAGWRATDRRAGVVRAKQYRRVVSSLHHLHLPELAGGGLVVVDDDTVRPADWPAWVDRCLDLAFAVEMRDDERRDHPDELPGERDGRGG